MAANPTKPASKRADSRKRKAKPSQPDDDEIAERAYFIHLEQGSSDELAHCCAPSANSKPPDVPRFSYADAVRCRARLDPARDGRSVGSRLVVGVTCERCVFGGATWRHARPSA